MRAGAYVDAGCYQRARQELVVADTALESEGRGEDDRETRRAAHDGMRELTVVLEKLESGNKEDAKRRLFGLLDSNRATEVLWRSTNMLGWLLVESGNSTDWERFSKTLDVLASGQTPDSKFWQVDYFRRLADARQGRTRQAIDLVAAELSQPLPLQRHLALQVLLGELLLADKRYASARVFCSAKEGQVGEGLFDVQLRLRFLEMCLSAWKQKENSSPDAVSTPTVRVLGAAVQRLRMSM